MKILAPLLALPLSVPALAVDPPWPRSCRRNQAPKGNAFTREVHDCGAGGPAVTDSTPANRAAIIHAIGPEGEPQKGDAVSITSQLPSLALNVEATAERRVAVKGPGDAGIETMRSHDGGAVAP